jgi:Ca2+-binding EF-hand superfamily protein
VRLFESVNFKEFVRLLSAFSSRASREVKLDAMFSVWDVDGDGE